VELNNRNLAHYPGLDAVGNRVEPC
jgi:hypothetical protein